MKAKNDGIFDSYIDGGDGKMIIQMGIRGKNHHK